MYNKGVENRYPMLLTHTFGRTWILFAALLVAVAAVSAQDQPAPQTESNVNKKGEKVELPKAAIVANVDPSTYHIGALDVLSVQVWQEPSFSFVGAVRPDGKLTLPLDGDITCAEMTPDELRAEITKRLKQYLQNPQVTISVVDVRSKWYFLVGQLGRTGQVPLERPTTVLEALAGSGGFRPFAKTKKIIVLRNGQRIPFNYNDVIKGKNMEQNIKLQHGDYIIVN